MIAMSKQSVENILTIMQQPLLELVYQAASIHRLHHNPRVVQLSSLISIKTGGCPEDCAYCPQAARYSTDLKKHGLLPLEKVLEVAAEAKANGSSRICMGAAWRKVRDNDDFDKVLTMVKAVSALDVEVCCTLGMLTEQQALRLEQAGLSAYNHNIDTSSDYYKTIVSTRTYDDRLQTLHNVRKAKISVCSGGIIGMGESEVDRAAMLCTLASLDPQPESVPINSLVPVEGTPLGDRKIIDPWEVIRMIATTRIVLPKTMVRLSAGRSSLSDTDQALCFLAGANSVFSGEKLLTTSNPDQFSDRRLFARLGITHQLSL
jgi:biotin synthase